MQEFRHGLRARLAALRGDGDLETLRSDEALAEATRLHCALADAEESAGAEPAEFLSAWSALAEFHEERSRPGPVPDTADALADFYRAAFYRCRLYRHRPDLLSDEQRQVLDDRPEILDVLGADPRTCVARVVLVARGLRTGDGDRERREGLLGRLVAQAGALVPPGHPRSPDLMAARGHMAYTYHCLTNDDDWLTAAIDELESALRALPDRDPMRAPVLNDLAGYLRRAAHRRSDTDLLARSAAAARRSLEATPVGTPEYAVSQITYAITFLERYEMASSADHALIDEAESLTRAAIDSGSLQRADEAKALSNLSRILLTQYERTRQLRCLEKCVEVSRRAVEIGDERDEDHSMCRANLGIALTAFARARANDPELLRQAEEELTTALGALAGDESRSYALSALGLVRRITAAQSPGTASGDVDPDDLQRQAVEALPEGHPDQVLGLLHLADAAVTRHLELGDEASWGQYLGLLRRIARVPGRQRATRMIALAQALTQKSPEDDAWAEAEELLTDVVEGGWALQSDARSATLVRARLLRSRFQAGRDERVGTLRAAAVRAALQAVEDGYPLRDRPVPLPRANDGRSLMLGIGEVAGLDRAIALLRADQPPEQETQERAEHLLELSSALHCRYLHDNDVSLLKESVAICRDMHRLAGEGTEQATLIGTMLASRLRELNQNTPSTGALAEAAVLFRTAATTGTERMRVRLDAACNWARSAEALGDSEQASQAYGTALDLLELASWSGIDREGQETLLRASDGLARDAAALAIGRREYERAVELLECGRGIQLGRALGGQAALRRVARVAPELAEQFARAHAKAEAPPVPDAYGGALSTGERLAAARRRNQLVELIRDKEVLADFLTRPSYPVLRDAATEGPVIIVSTSRSRCDALVVRAQRNVLAIPLDGVTDDLVRSYARRFSLGMAILEGEDLGLSQRTSGRHLVATALEWLWHQVCAPVLNELGYTRAKSADEAERVWWCPTGAFASLPLHAAGLHNRQRADGQSVLDRVVSSYTPTLRQLIDCRSAPLTPTGRPLLVAVPDSRVGGGQRTLPTAQQEAEIFLRYFPTARALVGPAATEAAVREHLQRADWAHFACHGAVRGPSGEDDARLLLYDEELRMGAVSGTSPDRNGEFAFLSACGTARTVSGLSDESLNLATMMQLAGYRHVIGTLWSIDDAMAPMVAAGVYSRLARSTGEVAADGAARALHCAVLDQRHSYPMASVGWCSYVHLGP